MDSSNSGSTSNDLSTKSQLYPSPPTNVDINDMTTGVSGDKYELNAFLKDATPIPTEDDTQNAHSITQNHTEVTDDIETDPSKNKDMSNKDRRRMNRLQSGTTGNKYQNAQRFPGGHNKANESRDKPTAVVNPLSDNKGGEKKTVGNSKETKGGYRQYRDNFVHKETDDYVYFWRQGSPFSQWHPSEFTIDGLKFNCAEQYMMYNKARFANCEALMIAILNEPNPDVQKDYGRKVPNLDFDGWYSVSSDIVRKGNRAKFSQNEHLKEKLFSTYPKKLVEASPHDQIWGIGLHADDPRALNESKWRGTNLLGRILTEVRDELLDETGFLAKKE